LEKNYNLSFDQMGYQTFEFNGVLLLSYDFALYTLPPRNKKQVSSFLLFTDNHQQVTK